jgi:hypothetical protein
MSTKTHLYSATLAAALAVAVWPLSEASAAEKTAINPTGNWKVTYGEKSQSTFVPTLKLKLQGDKLTGTLTRRHNQQDVEMRLEDAKLNGSEISFTVTIPPVSGNGPSATRKFKGTVSGDSIKGKVQLEWAGETRTSDWEAKRIRE